MFRNKEFSGKLIQSMEGLELVEFHGEESGEPQSRVTIPSQIEGHPIFRLTDNLFAGNHTLEEIHLGNDLVCIGKGTFADCTSLKRVEIPASVKVIFKDAFRGCSSLTEVVLHEGLTHIGPGAFRDCPNLKHVQVPQSVGYLAKTAFDDFSARKKKR